MLSYRKKLIFGSVALHIVAICAFLFYWIFYAKNEPKETPQPEAKAAPQDTSNSPQKKKSDIPDTGKNPYDDYEEGDLKKEQINKILTDSIDLDNADPEEKMQELDAKFNQLSRTSTKEVENMAKVVAQSAGVQFNSSKKPATEYSSSNSIDFDSIKLQDFEITEKNEYILIFKDKNNVYIKDGPHKYEDIDESLRVRLDIVKKAKENKKMRILLNVTDSIMDSLFTPQKNETSTKKADK